MMTSDFKDAVRMTPPDGALPDGVLIAALDADPMLPLANTLAAQGRATTVFARESPELLAGTSVVFHPWEANTRATTFRSVEALQGAVAPPLQLVVSMAPREARCGITTVDHSAASWHAITGDTLLRTTHLLQALGPQLRRARASVVFVGVSISLVGAAQLAPLVTLQESQRGLMKSLARQWGADGVTVNWIALHAPTLWPELARIPLPSRAEAIPLALGRRPNAADDLAGALDYFASEAGRAVTGATLTLDGGEWLLP